MRLRLLLFLLAGAPRIQAQVAPVADSVGVPPRKCLRAALRIAVPAALVSVGVLANKPAFNPVLCQAKEEFQEETQEAFAGFNAHGLDNYTRHLPLVAAYGLMAAGRRGERTAAGFTLVYLVAHGLDQGIVSNLKRVTRVARPDDPRDFSSFPSAHTSQAFLTATLLHEQYGRQYPWVSVSGYAVAAATGTMRVLGNRHWATDALAGAAIGFLSAETAWHLYPAFTRLLPGRLAHKLLLVPTYLAGGGAGVAVALTP